MCTVHCNEGYDMAFRPRPWYYCESDGNWRRGNTKWSKKPTVPECSGTKIAQATASSMTISSNGALSVGPCFSRYFLRCPTRRKALQDS